MTLEEVLAILAALLAGGGLGWALFRKKNNQLDPVITEPIGERPTSEPVVEAGMKPIRLRLDEATSDAEGVEDSPTPATDAAELARDRARHREE
jgi:hypothetical protein